ncbi:MULTISPECIES: hypothetical protein [unclassified Chitinophaga]|uniref:hypothetical protein n=1 Tax=unclassified Chitinophaga TaxID=2619133 RepID=UPI00300F9801
MSKQDGLLQFNGAIENLSFYKTKRGYVVRKRSGVSGARISADPAFQRSRENSMEFGRAGRAGKLLRSAFRYMIRNAADSGITPRLLREFLKVIKADVTSERGYRNVMNGDIKIMEKFEFNTERGMSTSFYAPLTATIDRVTGEGTIVIPPFYPAREVQSPRGATHVIITCGFSAIDFEEAQYESDEVSSEALVLDSHLTEPLTLTASVSPGSPFPLFLAFSVEFVQMVNERPYRLSDGAYNAMKMLVADSLYQ